MLDYSKSFIETQFPVSKISKESYKERKAGASQTLTGLGKWWGRKPLILVRATLLGILMPVSDNPVKDREIFLKILTMDNSGLWLRKNKPIKPTQLYDNTFSVEHAKYFEVKNNKPKLLRSLTKKEKDYLQELVFNRLSYDEKLKYCDRPENILLTDKTAWKDINAHLKTNANNLSELIKELGEKRFNHQPKVGDVFSGGGSIPFESANIGADVYASDLNPMASLLNWANLNLLSLSDEDLLSLGSFQDKVYDKIVNLYDEWQIEDNEDGMKGKYYLYCVEAKCPECQTTVPMIPNLLISESYKTIAVLEYNSKTANYDIDIKMNVSKEEMKYAIANGTVKKNSLVCPHCQKITPVSSLRNDKKIDGQTIYGLRKWTKQDIVSRNEDIYSERLYCIKYIDKFDDRTWDELMKKPGPATDSTYGKVYYLKPNENDIRRENKVLELLEERFSEWQKKGYIPSSLIEDGYNTSQLIRERGWKYWHQLFNPRQLLMFGLFNELSVQEAENTIEKVASLLGINKCVDWNSKLCIWNTARDVLQATFTNQSLNTMFNFASRGLSSIYNIWKYSIKNRPLEPNFLIDVKDARLVSNECDVWITDPPYADAVNYHELTEFFLAWDKALIKNAFPKWYTDSKRVLAVKGTGNDFNHSMIEIYGNLANHMPENGYQVVMFTHQDVKVWSELSMILWSAGLRVVSAWNIATETESGGLKAGGNYVKGTVLLTLKKQSSSEFAFQDELYDEIKYEVKHIIDSMKELDDKDDPDFTDADYLLASYASTLKVLTSYKEIDGVDVEYWLSQPRDSKEENPIEKLINKAVRIAYDYLIPEGFDTSLWKDLKPEERFYVRGLEVEMSGVAKISSYQELARGFGVSDYTDMFANFKANSARLKTPSEYRMSFLNGDGFNSTLLRNILVAIYETTENKSTVEGRAYLKNVYQQDNQYWYKKPLMIELLSFIANLEYVDHMKHWHENAYSAKILKEALKNEGV